MEIFLSASITKEDAKRLLFFFPKLVEYKAYAGRKSGIHADPEEEKGFKTHRFGRSLRTAPTTNGATILLEWSCTIAQMPNEAVVFIAIYKKARKWIIRVAPHKAYKFSQEGSVKFGKRYESEGITPRDTLVILQETNRIRFKFGQQEMYIRKDDIHSSAWAVWTAHGDYHKYDAVLQWNGEKVVDIKNIKPTGGNRGARR